MRRHVLNHFTERRRHVARGHSYKLPDRHSMKRQKHPGQLYICKCVCEFYNYVKAVQKYPDDFHVRASCLVTFSDFFELSTETQMRTSTPSGRHAGSSSECIYVDAFTHKHTHANISAYELVTMQIQRHLPRQVVANQGMQEAAVSVR